MSSLMEMYRKPESSELAEEESEQNAPLRFREGRTNALLEPRVSAMRPVEEIELLENALEEAVARPALAPEETSELPEQNEATSIYVGEEEPAELEHTAESAEEQQLEPGGPIHQDFSETPAAGEEQQIEIGHHNSREPNQTDTHQEDPRALLEISEFEPAKLEALNAITSAQHSAVEPLENAPSDLQLTNTPTDEALTMWKTGAYEGVDGFYYDDSLKEDLAEIAERQENGLGISL